MAAAAATADAAASAAHFAAASIWRRMQRQILLLPMASRAVALGNTSRPAWCSCWHRISDRELNCGSSELKGPCARAMWIWAWQPRLRASRVVSTTA